MPANPARRSTRRGECRTGRGVRRSRSFTPLKAFTPFKTPLKTQQNPRLWELRTSEDVKKVTGKAVLEEEEEEEEEGKRV